MSLTKAQLQALNVATTYANNANEVEAAGQQAFFNAMIEAMYPSPTAGNTSIPAYSPTTEYAPGPNVVVLYNDTFWRFVSTTSRTGVEPGTDANVWVELPTGALAHAQNTDYKNSTYTGLLDGGGIYDLRQSQYEGFNTFILQGNAGGGSVTASLLTGSQFDHSFLCYVPTGSTFTVTFETDTNQEIGVGALVLAAKDFAVFRHIQGKTYLLFSNKRPGGAGGNPFDQDLNTTDNPTFGEVTQTALAGIGDRAILADPDGKPKAEQLVSINDVIFEQLRIIDQADSVITTWQVINRELVRVDP